MFSELTYIGKGFVNEGSLLAEAMLEGDTGIFAEYDIQFIQVDTGFFFTVKDWQKMERLEFKKSEED